MWFGRRLIGCLTGDFNIGVSDIENSGQVRAHFSGAGNHCLGARVQPRPGVPREVVPERGCVCDRRLGSVSSLCLLCGFQV